MRGAEGVVDVDVTEFRQRRAELLHVLRIRLDLQPVQPHTAVHRRGTARRPSRPFADQEVLLIFFSVHVSNSDLREIADGNLFYFIYLFNPRKTQTQNRDFGKLFTQTSNMCCLLLQVLVLGDLPRFLKSQFGSQLACRTVWQYKLVYMERAAGTQKNVDR